MNTRYRRPIILFLASFILIIAGMVMKVTAVPGASLLFGGGMLVQMFSILWLLVVVLKGVKKK